MKFGRSKAATVDTLSSDDGNSNYSDPPRLDSLSLFPLPLPPERGRPSSHNHSHSRSATRIDSFVVALNEREGSSASLDASGLTLIHSSPKPEIDIVFIHGLGGSSVRTWCYKREPKNFWPPWLLEDPEFSNARLFTFGYNADFRGASTSLNITDFAKYLLQWLLTFSEGPPIGQRPLIFIAHSMGGIVAKKAYILGKHDKKFSDIISQVRGIVFLATPHRGSNYARTLNSLLAAFGLSKKEYVSQLDTTSSTIQDINNHFRTVCSELILVSFYETTKTLVTIGVKRMVVEKASAVLDYPQEYSSPISADHHGICKYQHILDKNYIAVKNMLKLTMSKALNKSTAEIHSRLTSQARLERPGRLERHQSGAEILKRLENILGVHDSLETDFNNHKEKIYESSCLWITRKPSFRHWIDNYEANPSIFWLTGPPAAGKSTVASFMIDWIRNNFLESSCEYHFFVSSHQMKRKVSYFLRMIAYQLAQSHENIQEALLQLNDETEATFGSQSTLIIWEKIFEGIIFRVPLETDLVWVIDALEEADTAITLCNLFGRVRSVNRIKIFITSRKTKDLPNILYDHPMKIIHEAMKLEDTEGDIRAYVSQVVRNNLPLEAKRDDIIEEILEKANGSFLWVRLVLDTICESWHTQQDVERAMLEAPVGMQPLYERMLETVVNQPERNREIAREILTWAACSFRPLRTAELEAALAPKFAGFLSLADTIGQLCGHFVEARNGKITLVHSTARHFLLTRSGGFVSKSEGHSHLASICLQYLSDDNWKSTFTFRMRGFSQSDMLTLAHFDDDYPFLNYAVHHWAYHVGSTSSDGIVQPLEYFFGNYVLSWIHAVAISKSHKTLSNTAKQIQRFARRKARTPSNVALNSLHIQDFQWLRLWATDLIRILAKFGRVLTQSPTSIYRLIPIFCPAQSQFGSAYGRSIPSMISLDGLSTSSWDDCLARMSSPEGETISRVLATDTYFITLMSSSGNVDIWSTETFEEFQHISHGEYVTHMAVDKLGTTLVTAGVQTIRLWEIGSGLEIYSFPRGSEAKTMAICFHDDNIVISRDDFSIQTHDVQTESIVTTFWACFQQEGFGRCPRFMQLSPDSSKVAVAERGKPVLIWDLNQSRNQIPWRCVRREDSTRHLENQEAWNCPEVVCWHPEGTSIFILYQDSNIVHWDFLDDIQWEYSLRGAREMTVSKDGQFLLTGSSSGTLSVWALPRFNLLYKLFHEEFVRDLTLSPDGQRIYDARGSFCHVWEPEVLATQKVDEKDELTSNPNSSTIADPVITECPTSVQLTALACDREDRYYCCGNGDGSVSIHSSSNGERVRRVYNHAKSVAIVALSWSDAGRYITSADDAGRVICKRLEVKQDGQWAVFPVLDIRLADPVRQFLFNGDESLLLISTESHDILWNVQPKTKQEVRRKVRSHFTGHRWKNHPLNPAHLIWIDPLAIMTFNWSDLKVADSPPGIEESEDYSRISRNMSSITPDCVRCISQSHNGRYVLFEIVPDTVFARSLTPEGLKIQGLQANSLSDGLQKRIEFVGLSTQIIRFLGIFRDRIVFVDRRFWICSCEISPNIAQGAFKKHFFLPRDWMTPINLALVTLNSHGTVFAPRNGEVAIIKNGIKL